MFWLKVFFTLISFIQIGFHKKTRSFFIHLCIYENAEKGEGQNWGLDILGEVFVWMGPVFGGGRHIFFKKTEKK